MNREHANQLAQSARGIISLGYIARVGTGEEKGLYRVGIDGIMTDWIEGGKVRAGSKRTKSTYSKGEQVLVGAPNGDLSQGVIICSVNSEQYPQPTDNDDLDITVYDDGTTISYDEGTQTLHVLVAGAGIINIECQTATVKAEEVKIDATKTIVTGVLEVLGQIIGKAGMAVSGGGEGGVATFSGSVTVTGGDVKADGVGLKSHTHKEQGDGNDVGPARG